MAAFEYTAINVKGKTVKGVMEGDNDRQIRQKLREQALTPLNVLSAAPKNDHSGDTSARSFSFLKRGIRVSQLDLTLVTRQLSTLVKSGMTIEKALYSVGNQSEKANITKLLMAVRAKVLEGHTLASGFAQFPSVFPEIFRSTIASGEASGNLDEVLSRLADYMDRQHEMGKKLTQSLIYPVVLVFVSIIVVSILLAYVVPKVAKVFESSQATLPLMTRIVMWLSDMIQTYGVFVAIALMVGGVVWQWWLSDTKHRFKFHQRLLKLPIWGKLTRASNAAAFARTLGILVSSRVSVLDAMRIAADVMTSLPMRDAVINASKDVKEGVSISKSLEKTKYFPPIMLHLMASGESSGALSEMLISAADYQDMEVESRTSTMMSLFQPFVILIMGGVIASIMVAVLLPIAQMSNVVG